MNQEELAAWAPLLQAEFQKPYWLRLCQAVEAAYHRNEELGRV